MVANERLSQPHEKIAHALLGKVFDILSNKMILSDKVSDKVSDKIPVSISWLEIVHRKITVFPFELFFKVAWDAGLEWGGPFCEEPYSARVKGDIGHPPQGIHVRIGAKDEAVSGGLHFRKSLFSFGRQVRSPKTTFGLGDGKRQGADLDFPLCQKALVPETYVQTGIEP